MFKKTKKLGQLVAKDVPRTPVIDPSLAALGAKRSTLERLSRDGIALPIAEDREGYFAGRDFEYWLSGLNDLQQVIKRLGSGSSNMRMLDFGGATGRVVRHAMLESAIAECVVADINVRHVQWINTHLPINGRGIRTDFRPPIPIEDGYFDITTAFSVFTHIDEYETTWLAELVRVTKPGGLLYLTVHNNATWMNLEGTYVLGNLRPIAEFGELYVPGQDLPAERISFRYSEADAYNTNVFHSDDYLKRVWQRFAEVEEVVPMAHSYQAAVVLRKRG